MQPVQGRNSISQGIGARQRRGRSLYPFSGYVIAGVAAENLDGGVDGQGREYAKQRHLGVAFLANTQTVVLIRRTRRKIRVV